MNYTQAEEGKNMKSDVGEGRAVKNGYAGGCTEPIINMKCAQGKLIEREQIRMKNTYNIQ